MIMKSVDFIKGIFKIFLKLNWLFSLVSMVFILFLYFRLPQNVPMHINAFLRIDGFGNKIGIFLIPLCLFLFGILVQIVSQKYDLYFCKFNNVVKVLILLFLLFLWIVCIEYLVVYFKMAF